LLRDVEGDPSNMPEAHGSNGSPQNGSAQLPHLSQKSRSAPKRTGQCVWALATVMALAASALAASALVLVSGLEHQGNLNLHRKP